MLIWGVLVCGVGALVMPHLISAEMMGSVEAMRAGTLDPTAAGVDMEMVQTLATATDFGYVFQIFAYLLLYVIGGYLLYSAMFAAVGSAVDNVQDAQQLQTPDHAADHPEYLRDDGGDEGPQFAAWSSGVR